MTTCLPAVLVSDRSFRDNKLIALPAGLFSGMPELRYLWVAWIIGWVRELSVHHSLRFRTAALVFITHGFLDQVPSFSTWCILLYWYCCRYLCGHVVRLICTRRPTGVGQWETLCLTSAADELCSLQYIIPYLLGV